MDPEDRLTLAHIDKAIAALKENEQRASEQLRLFVHHSQFNDPVLMAALKREYPDAKIMTIRPLPIA